MKNNQFISTLRLPSVETKINLMVLFSLVLIFGLGACSKLNKAENPSPTDPFAVPIGNLVLQSDTNGNARLSLSSLRLDQSKPFSFSTRNFQQGDFDLQGDSALVFVATEAKKWKADSGFVSVGQNGKTKEGFLKIINQGYKLPVAVTWETVYLKGTPIADMAPIYLDFMDPRTIPNLNGMSETGAILDSVWGFIHQAGISNDQQKITYLAAGGIGNFLNFGTDHIYYRVKRSNGLYFRGMIPVYIGDTSRPMAKNDVRTIQPAGDFILWSTLMANDLSSTFTPPQLPATLRLEPVSYIGKKKINTVFGTLQDTLQDGNPAFYYKRYATGIQADTTFIFLQEGSDSRITRSRLILNP